MRFLLYLLIPAGIAIAFFMMQYLTASESGPGTGLSRDQIESEMSVQGFDRLFEEIDAVFPLRMAAHRDQILDIVRDGSLSQARKGQQVMAANREFTDALLRQHAPLVARASEERLLDLQRAALLVLRSVSNQPELCTRLASRGLSGLSRHERAMLDQAALQEIGLAQIRAIQDAQNNPVTRAAPDEADWDLFIKDWFASEPDAEEAIRAFIKVDTQVPEIYCNGAVSFYRQMVQDGSAEGVRIMAEFGKTDALR